MKKKYLLLIWEQYLEKEENANLPLNNTLRRSQSDVVGEINYNPVENFNLRI